MLERFNAEVFLKIAELGSYRKAADALGYTQAGIKYIVDAMEEEAGLKFFAREYGGVSLTENGQDILSWVKQLKGSQDALSDRVEELVHLRSGRIRIMCFNSLLVYWLPDVIRRFHEDHPEVDIELIACDRFDEMEEKVYRREADLGFFLLPVKRDLEVKVLSEEPMLLACSHDHPLGKEDPVDPKDLVKYTYIGSPLEHDPGMQEFFKRYDISPKVGFSTENDNAALALTGQGLGYCVYPRFMLEGSHFDLHMAEFKEPLRWSFAIGARSFTTCSKAAATFIEYALSEKD